MAKKLRPWDRDPKAFVVSVFGAFLILLGLAVVNSIPLVALGAIMTLVGYLLDKRAKRRTEG